MAELFLCLYLKGPGIEDTMNGGRQGCGAGSGRTKPSSLALISLAFLACCFSHPFVRRPVCSPLCEPSAASLLRGSSACVWYGCVCMREYNYSLQSQRWPTFNLQPPPHPSSSPRHKLVASSQGQPNEQGPLCKTQ